MACTKNPVVEYIKYVISLYEADPAAFGNSLFEAFDENTTHVFTSTTNTEYCCPDCGSYIFTLYPAAITTFLGDNPGITDECCLNYDNNDILPSPYLDFLHAVQAEGLSVCCNSFQSCIEDFLKLLQDSYLSIDAAMYRANVLELGTINGDSGLCVLYDYLKNSNLSANTLYVIFNVLTTYNGISVKCDYDPGTLLFSITVNLL
jgi:hypothetical protein